MGFMLIQVTTGALERHCNKFLDEFEAVEISKNNDGSRKRYTQDHGALQAQDLNISKMWKEEKFKFEAKKYFVTSKAEAILSKQSGGLLEVNIISTMVEVANLYDKLIEETMMLTEEIVDQQDKYLVKLGSMKDDEANILHAISQNIPLKEKLVEYSRSLSQPLVAKSVKNIEFHAALTRLSGPMKTGWKMVSNPKSQKEIFAAWILPRLRSEKTFLKLNKIVYKAAIEEVFHSRLKYGEITNKNDQLITTMAAINCSELEQMNSYITYLVRAFVIFNVEPQGFIEAKQKWIKSIHESMLDIERVSKDFQGGTYQPDITNGFRTELYVFIERLDEIMMKIYSHRHIDEGDCNFLFGNINYNFWNVSRHSKGMIKSHSNKVISHKLLSQWKDVLLQTQNKNPLDHYHDLLCRKQDGFKQHAAVRNPVRTQHSTNLEEVKSGIGHIKASEGKNQFTVPKETTIKSRIQERYSNSPSLFLTDYRMYEIQFRGLIEKLHSFHQTFVNQSTEIRNELSTVYDWYSTKAHILYRDTREATE